LEPQGQKQVRRNEIWNDTCGDVYCVLIHARHDDT
jgi:hypothetical protein